MSWALDVQRAKAIKAEREAFEMQKQELHKKAMAEDVRAMNIMAYQGDVNGIAGILESRVNTLRQQGGDATESLATLNMIRSGDPQQIGNALADLAQADQIAVANGFLPPMIPTGGAEYESVVTGDDGQRYGLINGQYQKIPAPPGFSARSNAPVTNVNLGGKKEAEVLATNRANHFDELRTAANNATDQNARLAQLENLDPATGFGVGTRMKLARVVNGLTGSNMGEEVFGVEVPALQVYNSIAESMVNSALNEAIGPQTDQDAERMRSTMMGIDKESDANRWMIASLKETNLRRQEQYRFYDDFLKKNDTLKGADSAWLEYKQKTPMVGSAIDKETGLPLLFSQFMQKAKKANPGATRAQLLEAWRQLNAS